MYLRKSSVLSTTGSMPKASNAPALASCCTASLIALLSACASAPKPRADARVWQGRWLLRLAGPPEQVHQAQFELSGQAQSGELLLISPLGSVLARLRWTPHLAELESPGRVEQAPQLATLLQARLGVALPVPALFDWLQGRPTEVPGWQVQLQDLGQGRLQLTHLNEPQAQLRLILDRP